MPTESTGCCRASTRTDAGEVRRARNAPLHRESSGDDAVGLVDRKGRLNSFKRAFETVDMSISQSSLSSPFQACECSTDPEKERHLSEQADMTTHAAPRTLCSPSQVIPLQTRHRAWTSLWKTYMATLKHTVRVGCRAHTQKVLS